jgi:hypothetical protein
MDKRGDQLVLSDTDAGTGVCACAGTLGERLKESCFTPPDLGRSQCKNPVVPALVAALVLASVVELQSPCGSEARLRVPASCSLLASRRRPPLAQLVERNSPVVVGARPARAREGQLHLHLKPRR